jgi:hypothetical protein
VVNLRPDVQFRSGFPDDGDYEVDVQPGRNIAQTLRTALVQLAYRVSEPINGGDHGWELDIWRGRKRLWLQISVLGADECYLMTENMTFWLWPDIKLFQTFLADLQRVLEEDDRFSLIGWFPKGGSARTMEPADTPFDP